ncbi:MAG: ABC transporter permease, partial [Ignavibacteriaceae bacterium]|nr:ABC transporter permease [Ignavibacteriaceae bacterium]
MKSEIIKTLFVRFLSSVLTLFLLVSFLFIIIRLSPGDPTDKYISAKLGSELSESIAEKFSLNQPVTNQYFSFVANVFSGDMGVSYNYRLPVFEVIWEYFSFTLVFASISFIFQMSLSIWLALWVIKKQKKWLNKFVTDSSLFIYSIPAFVLGVALIYIFSVSLNLFPISGLKSLDYDNLSFFSQLLDKLHHLVMPLITLTAAGVAMFYKYIKESMDEVLQQTFVTNLRASGVDENIILLKHVIPNALRPLISVAGIELGILLGGTLITEVIFSLPGMGRLTVDSIFSRDYPLVIGCVFTAGAVMILANFLADIIKLKIDKRLIKG